VATTLNSMLAALEESERKLEHANDTLEQQVRERTDQLRRSDRLVTIGTLAAGVAHDLNNLLLPMRSRLRVLEASDLSPQAREQLDDLRQSIQFLREMGESLRMCSLDPNDPGDSAGKTDVAVWWRQVEGLLARALKSRAAGREATLRADIEPRLPAVGVASHRLTQAVLNLVVNAGDAARPGAPADVALTARQIDGEWVEIAVEDNGVGMPPEVLERAADPFFPTTRRGASTGLGLALVQGVARGAGGAMDIHSVESAGTRVALRLPRVWKEQKEPAEAAASKPLVAVSLRDMRMAAFASSLAASAGLHVARTEAADPGEAHLWLTEADEQSLEAARTFIRRGDGRSVIVVGAADARWRELGASSIEGALDAESLAQALRRAGVKGWEQDNGEAEDTNPLRR
ncbi:MAG: HAMP domain-containing sensor histidine kinase, partial [Planctomycetota bacterium]|nr:HAMP domain-containing sensor histidine kinase [Planctomycetota bacterium]